MASEDPKQQIMAATYEALCEHGYATLSIEKIAQKLDMEKSAIYYHYDDKDDLLASFLSFMEAKIQEQVPLDRASPEERLEHFLALALGTADDEKWEFREALFEMQSEGPHNPAFAAAFADINDLLRKTLTDILDEMGIEDSKQQAEYMFYCIEGVIAANIAEDDRDSVKELEDRLKDYFIEE